MSGRRWADSSSDEEEEEEDEDAQFAKLPQAGLNDGFVQTKSNEQRRWYDYDDSDEDGFDYTPNQAIFSDDESKEQDDDNEEDSEEEEETPEQKLLRQEYLRQAREAASKKKQQAVEEESQKKPLSKKEKLALKEKELNDLDTLLHEFGLQGSNPICTNNGAEEVIHTTGTTPHDVTEPNLSSTNTNKKKKKKNHKSIAPLTNTALLDETSTRTTNDGNNREKEGTGTVSEQPDKPQDMGQTQQQMGENQEELQSSSTPALDVTSVMKAKVIKKSKEKTAAEVAAATAAKEAKAKKEAAAALAAKKQKKLNKDKYAFNGPKR